MKRLFKEISHALGRGEDLALAVVVESSGSVPRGAGAHMLAGRMGRICGTVGGGPGEARTLELCREALKRRTSVNGHISLGEDSSLGAVCGGELEVRVLYLSCRDEKTGDAVEQALKCFEEKIPCWLALGLDSDIIDLLKWEGLPGPPIPHRLSFVEGEFFVQPLLPVGRVIIFGGGHIAQALVPLLAGVDFRCLVVEDRPEFCEHSLFPQAEAAKLLRPEEWGKALGVTKEDYICIMTRGHENDLACLEFALRTPACYIGMLGSRRKTAHTNAELAKRGFGEIDTARIVTPIGLPILADGPEEIAVSIAAQLIKVRAERLNKTK